MKNIYRIISIITLTINLILIGLIIWPTVLYSNGTYVSVDNFIVLPIMLGAIDALYFVCTIIYLILRTKKLPKEKTLETKN